MLNKEHPGTRDSIKRSLLKTISWRICATAATIIIVYAFTKRPALSVGVGIAEVIIKMILYYLHERFWSTELPKVGEK